MKKRKPNNYWTYEKCKEEALKYTKRGEFIKNSFPTYNRIMINKWYELLNHLTSPQRAKNFYTYDNCKKISLQFNKICEFDKKEGYAYRQILKNKWYDLLSHMEYKSVNTKRHIYAFEFPDKNVYVGLTYNINKRKLSHITDENSSVFKYIKNYNSNYTFKILTKEPVCIKEAGKIEEMEIEKYKTKGWKIINKVRAGGLGGTEIKYTYNKCKKITQQFNLMSELYKNYPQSFRTTLKQKGWWDELTSHIFEDRKVKKPNGYWQIKENCKSESIKYKSKKEFEINNASAYNACLKNKWINDFF